MKGYIINPLAMLGAQLGYNRPLDRHDFPHGTIPDRAGLYVPGMGELRRFANLSVLHGAHAGGTNMHEFGTTQIHPLGTLAMTRDGRMFRYGSAGAVALVVGKIQQSAVPIADHLALTSAVEVIGAGGQDNPIVVTPGATGGAANLYADGYLNVDTTPSVGHVYRISGHPAITASVAFNLYLDPDDRVRVAFSTATRYGLIHNPFKHVVVAPTTVTANICGGAISAIPANTTADNYGWLQTRGPYSAMINGTPAVGTGLVVSVTTAGSLDVAGAVALEINYRIIARAMQIGVSGKHNLVYLMLD